MSETHQTQTGKLRWTDKGWYIDTRTGDSIPMASECFDMIEGKSVVFDVTEEGWVYQKNWTPCAFEPLTDSQVTELLAINNAARDNHEPLLIVRFLLDGCAMQLERGLCASKGSNVIYHPTYWDVPQGFIDKVKEIYPECKADVCA